MAKKEIRVKKGKEREYKAKKRQIAAQEAKEAELKPRARRRATKAQLAKEGEKQRTKIAAKLPSFEDPEYAAKKAAQEEFESRREKERRSKAGKKGWQTRQENQKREALRREFLSEVPRLESMMRALEKQKKKAQSRKEKERLQQEINKTKRLLIRVRELSLTDAQRLHAYRSRAARKRDEKSLARSISRGVEWALKPGLYDYPGVDTPDAKENPFLAPEKETEAALERAGQADLRARAILRGLSNKEIRHLHKRSDGYEQLTSAYAALQEAQRVQVVSSANLSERIGKISDQSLRRKLSRQGQRITRNQALIDSKAKLIDQLLSVRARREMRVQMRSLEVQSRAKASRAVKEKRQKVAEKDQQAAIKRALRRRKEEGQLEEQIRLNRLSLRVAEDEAKNLRLIGSKTRLGRKESAIRTFKSRLQKAEDRRAQISQAKVSRLVKLGLSKKEATDMVKGQ